MAVLTKEILFGMNLVTLAGFVLMGMSLHLGRTAKIRAAAAFAGMTLGTALVFLGIYVGGGLTV